MFVKKGRRKKIIYGMLAFAALFAAIILFVHAEKADRKEQGIMKEESASPVSVREKCWIFRGKKKDVKIESAENTVWDNCVKTGDILYNKAGYMLQVKDVYENKIILIQKGGFMPANNDGSFNALNSAKTEYEVWKGDPLKIRSRSIDYGILLEIVW